MRLWTVIAGVPAALLLSACADPRLTGSRESDRLLARRVLADVGSRGPVPLVILGDVSPLAEARVPALVTEGIAGLKPTFSIETARAAGERLVLWFDPPNGSSAQTACSGREPGAAPAEIPHLLAVWCEGAHPVAEVAGTAADASVPASERLVWQAAGRLFPDDYAERYGFNLFGWRVRLGAAAAF